MKRSASELTVEVTEALLPMRKSSKAQMDSPARDISSTATQDECGRKVVWGKAPPSTSRSRDLPRTVMDDSGTILLVEDNHNDVELILAALNEGELVEEFCVACDEQETLDYLYSQAVQRRTPT